MADITLSTAYNSFQTADKDKNGRLNRQEIATEAVRLYDAKKTDEAAFFAGILQGGKDKTGLFPDFYNAMGRPGQDNEVSMAEIAALAETDADKEGGNAETISKNDMIGRWGDRANTTNTLDWNELRKIAAGTSTGTGNCPKPDNSCSTKNPNNIQQMLQQLLPFLMMLMFGGMGQMGGGSWNQGYMGGTTLR